MSIELDINGKIITIKYMHEDEFPRVDELMDAVTGKDYEDWTIVLDSCTNTEKQFNILSDKINGDSKQD